MKKATFEKFLNYAKAQQGDYYAGYQQGIRRHYHGGTFTPGSGHEAWIALADERGDGYRDGEAGNPPRGIHGGHGNKNAVAETPRDAHIHIRVTMVDKNRYVWAAQTDGKTLSQWLTGLADAAAPKARK